MKASESKAMFEEILQSILSGIKHSYALLATFPYIPFLVVWLAVYWYCKDKKRASRISMDVTTALLIGSVSKLFDQVFNSGFGFYLIILVFILAFGLLGNLQNRIKGRINPKKLIKVIWRFGFVALSFAYILLFVVGIGKSIMTAG